MKINKSKQELARIISEHGGWRNGAEFYSQDKDGEVFPYATKPTINAGCEVWHHKGCIGVGEFTAETLPNWHQTILSREEYFHLYPAPDADGWIDWKGGECPVGESDRIDVKFGDGVEFFDVSSYWDWDADAGGCNIIAYRLHKPEIATSAREPKPVPVPNAKPTIEQLAADYRNKLDYANRKQDEADKANMESDAALAQLEDAIAAIGFVITPLAATEKEPELAITDWRDLLVGDRIWCCEDEELAAGEYVVLEVEEPVYGGVRAVAVEGSSTARHWIDTSKEWRFISRP